MLLTHHWLQSEMLYGPNNILVNGIYFSGINYYFYLVNEMLLYPIYILNLPIPDSVLDIYSYNLAGSTSSFSILLLFSYASFKRSSNTFGQTKNLSLQV
jgi:hypothetical protein